MATSEVRRSGWTKCRLEKGLMALLLQIGLIDRLVEIVSNLGLSAGPWTARLSSFHGGEAATAAPILPLHAYRCLHSRYLDCTSQWLVIFGNAQSKAV